MTGRGVRLEQVSRDGQGAIVLPTRRTVAEACVSGSPAFGGICVEHGESACVMTLHLAG